MSFGFTMVQNAYVVESLRASCEQMYRDFGMGPWIILEGFRLGNHKYRGTDAEDVIVDVAVTQSGELQIELVEVKSDGPNALSDMFTGKGTVFHHVAHLSDDYDFETVRDNLARAGHEIAGEFEVQGQRICFLDTRASLGHMLELYADIKHERNVYKQIRDVCDNWDGKELFLSWS